MSKNKNTANKQKKKPGGRIAAIWIAALLVVVLAALILVRMPDELFGKDSTGTEQRTPDFSMPTPEPTAAPTPTPEVQGPAISYGVELPYELEDGKLVITGLFTSDIMNPDAGNAYGKNIATVEIKNCSEEHLKSLELTVTTGKGETLRFTAQDIPAGRSVWAFETGNQSVDEKTAEYTEFTCSASFEESTPVRPEDFTITADGTKVTVVNNTATTWSNLAIDFHTLMDEENGIYFGGKTVTYTVKTLQGKGSATLDALDCYMGTAEAVRVRQGT